MKIFAFHFGGEKDYLKHTKAQIHNKKLIEWRNKNMEIKKVCDELKEILIESLEVNITKEEIDGTDLITELNINSVDALEILVRVENKYDIMIPDEDLSASLIQSLESFANYIIERCGV